MVSVSRTFSTGCAPIDKLLGGGLLRGSILEILGPPGAGKEGVTVGTVKEFVEANEGVVFIGKFTIVSFLRHLLRARVLDCQNMTSPAALYKALQG
jgi:predicted ATP-dependent serine protease